MDKISFDNKFKEIVAEKPKLFALESDNKANDEKINVIENHYKIKLPENYKEFVKQYGGGYFGFIVVFSCDESGMFFIKDYVSKEWIQNKSFLPVVDFETGDFIGFEVKEGICQNTVSLYSHEENKLVKLGMDFYDVLLKYGFKCNVTVQRSMSFR